MKNRERINNYLLAGDAAMNRPESQNHYTPREFERCSYPISQTKQGRIAKMTQSIATAISNTISEWRNKDKASLALCTATEGGVE